MALKRQRGGDARGDASWTDFWSDTGPVELPDWTAVDWSGGRDRPPTGLGRASVTDEGADGASFPDAEIPAAPIADGPVLDAPLDVPPAQPDRGGHTLHRRSHPEPDPTVRARPHSRFTPLRPLQGSPWTPGPGAAGPAARDGSSLVRPFVPTDDDLAPGWDDALTQPGTREFDIGTGPGPDDTARQRTVPLDGRPGGPPRRTAARRLVGTAVRVAAAAVAIAVAWRVLVTLRGGVSEPVGDDIAGRLDAVGARTLAADHLLSMTTWAGYISTTLVLGGVVFRRFVSPTRIRPPRRGHGARSPRPRVHASDAEKVLLAAAALGLVAVALSLPLRAAEVSGRGLDVLAHPQTFWVVLRSPFGHAALVRAAGLGLLVASRVGGPLRAVAAVAGWVILLASYLLVGHPQANHPASAEMAAQAVHITAVSVWFAGVAYLAVELRQRRTEGAPWLSARVVSRFSRLAEVMVLLVLTSGFVLTMGQVRLREEFWTTPYGKALVAKLAFVAVVLAIGGYNRQRVVPAVAERDEEAAWRHLRMTCVVESTVIAVGVLLMTAAMTSGGFP